MAKSELKNRAIILAAGRGSRLDELTRDKPKGMVEFQGKPLIKWQIDSMRSAGIEDIAIVTGYKNELYDGYVDHYFHNPDWMNTNMVSSLMCARTWLEISSCIVSYSDIFFPPSIITSLLDAKADIAISYDENWLSLWRERFEDPLNDAESFKKTPEGMVEEIGASVQDISEIDGQYMGLTKFRPRGWNALQSVTNTLDTQQIAKLDMTMTLSLLVSKGEKLEAVPFDDDWGEIDHQSDLSLYNKLKQSNRFKWMDSLNK